MPPWPHGPPEAVALLVYWDTVEECGGPTHFVAREGDDDEAYAWPHTKMPGQGGVPWMNDRSAAESYLSEHYPELAAFRQRLYAREKAVHYGVGTALLYHENTWSGAPHALSAAGVEVSCARAGTAARP